MVEVRFSLSAPFEDVRVLWAELMVVILTYFLLISISFFLVYGAAVVFPVGALLCGFSWGLIARRADRGSLVRMMGINTVVLLVSLLVGGLVDHAVMQIAALGMLTVGTPGVVVPGTVWLYRWWHGRRWRRALPETLRAARAARQTQAANSWRKRGLVAREVELVGRLVPRETLDRVEVWCSWARRDGGGVFELIGRSNLDAFDFVGAEHGRLALRPLDVDFDGALDAALGDGSRPFEARERLVDVRLRGRLVEGQRDRWLAGSIQLEGLRSSTLPESESYRAPAADGAA